MWFLPKFFEACCAQIKQPCATCLLIGTFKKKSMVTWFKWLINVVTQHYKTKAFQFNSSIFDQKLGLYWYHRCYGRPRLLKSYIQERLSSWQITAPSPSSKEGKTSWKQALPWTRSIQISTYQLQYMCIVGRLLFHYLLVFWNMIKYI